MQNEKEISVILRFVNLDINQKVEDGWSLLDYLNDPTVDI